ncbi:hypothetical protein [Dactylosporangium sp. NPDC049140]|uniref:hypothetical protein n=1 Tax=Dactylosporangium sp. NPDC049140 TaxID=3155647 RepID=UPI0033EF816F
MPPELVRPYVRVIPIAHIPPAPPRRSTVAPRPVPPMYRPRHDVVTRSVPSNPPQRSSRRRTSRRAPALAWGALLITLATASVALRPDVSEPTAQAAEFGHLETALLPAPHAEGIAQRTSTPPRPDAPTRRAKP